MGHWREAHCKSRKLHATASAPCITQARPGTREGQDVQTIKTVLEVRKERPSDAMLMARGGQTREDGHERQWHQRRGTRGSNGRENVRGIEGADVESGHI